MIIALAPWLSVLISLGTLVFAIYSTSKKAGIDSLSLDEDRIESLERRLANCEQKHDEQQRQLNDLRSENEWRGREITRLLRELNPK